MLRTSFSKIASRASSNLLGTGNALPSVNQPPYHPFSTRRDVRDEEVVVKNFSSSFDEADSLEVGKTQSQLKSKEQKQQSKEKAKEKLEGTELYETNFSDEFDESDSIETGKQQLSHVRKSGGSGEDYDPVQNGLEQSPVTSDEKSKTAERLKKNQTEVLETSFKPEFDESDSIETGKREQSKKTTVPSS